MKKSLIFLVLILSATFCHAQYIPQLNPRNIVGGVSINSNSTTVSMTDSLGGKIPSAAVAYSMAKFAAANAANLVKSLTDAKIATTNSNLNAEQSARINQIAAQQALITTLQNNATALQSLLTATQSQVTAQATQITNQGNLIGTQQTTLINQNDLLAKYRARMDSLSINPNDLITNPVMNQWVDTKIGGTYFAPTAISFGTITATSIQPVLALVSGATSYQLWKSTTSATAGFNFLTTLTPSNLLYNDTGLSASTNYWYRATATDGTHTSMPVTASATTLAATVDNSVASAGYAVIDYFNVPALTVSNGPNQYNGYSDANIYFETNPNSGLSIVNGVMTAVAGTQNFKLTYAFVANKTYKITLYNNDYTSLTTTGSYIYNNGGLSIAQSGNNSILSITTTAAGAAMFIGIAANTQSSFAALKLEVQN